METIKIANKTLTCDICSGNDFGISDSQLNTKLLSFLHLDWLNKSSKIFVCQKCLNIKWFMTDDYEILSDETVEEIKEEFSSQIDDEIQCLNCGQILDPHLETCKNCGWSYK